MSSVVGARGSGSLSAKSDSASTLFSHGKYAEALNLWYTIVQSGNTDPNLYFNIGNAESLIGHVPESILAYEKAEKFKPSDHVIKEAIKKEREKIENAVIPVSSFFLIDWYRGLISLFRPGGWIWLALLLLCIGIVKWLVEVKSIRIHGWITGRNKFYFLEAGLVCIAIGFLSYHQLHHSNEAIVMTTCDFRQAASGESPVVRTLYPGEKVKITDHISNWNKVSLLNLDEGWINADCLKLIQ